MAIAVVDGVNGFGQGSPVLRWNGNIFVQLSVLPTFGANDFEAFTIGDEHYLAVANTAAQGLCRFDSAVFRWTGEDFALDAHLANTRCAWDVEAFVIEGVNYLAVAQYKCEGSYDIGSKVFKWNVESSEWQEHQGLASKGANDISAFSIGGLHFLMVANYKAALSFYQTPSELFVWCNGTFVRYQQISSAGAADSVAFTIDGNHFLALAASRLPSSTIYKWDTGLVRQCGTDHQQVNLSDTIAATTCSTPAHCLGHWSSCTSACENASERVWYPLQQPSANSAACPEPVDCDSGLWDCQLRVCAHQDTHRRGIDWDYYYQYDNRFHDCATCLNKCELDTNCGAAECGISWSSFGYHRYCKWWNSSACQLGGTHWANKGDLMTCWKSETGCTSTTTTTTTRATTPQVPVVWNSGGQWQVPMSGPMLLCAIWAVLAA